MFHVQHTIIRNPSIHLPDNCKTGARRRVILVARSIDSVRRQTGVLDVYIEESNHGTDPGSVVLLWGGIRIDADDLFDSDKPHIREHCYNLIAIAQGNATSWFAKHLIEKIYDDLAKPKIPALYLRATRNCKPTPKSKKKKK